MKPEPVSLPLQWMVDVNARLQRVADLLVSLSTGALILPPIFLREYLGIRDEPLAMFLDTWALASVGAFGMTILSGIAFHCASAARIRQAWGQPTYVSPGALGRLLGAILGATIIAFLVGVGSFLVFMAGA